jgi:uncharacterized membrane protein YeaQ/YmgE (transglycosylase-associated protein family)
MDWGAVSWDHLGVIFLIFGLLLGGLVVGALGRLVVPGPNPIGIWRTIAAGVAGSFLGGLVTRLAFGWRFRYSGLAGLVIAVAFTALIVAAMSRRSGWNRST